MNPTPTQLEQAIQQFQFAGHFLDVEPHGHGHINDTYLVRFHQAGGQIRRYILQRINTRVFQNPRALMENIAKVTSFLRQVIAQSGGDPDRESLTLIQTRAGENWLQDGDNNFWRAYLFIENAASLQQADSIEPFISAAKAFGQFQLRLQAFPAHELHETIANFHNTPKRLNDLKIAVQQDIAGRVSTVSEELAFVFQREHETGKLLDALAQGQVPLRVTHNDTKLNNVMLDLDTGAGVCVIDLDTVMPGLSLYDYGDAIRFGASSADEDERDLTRVWFDLDKAAAYTQGFFETASSILTPAEKELAPWGAKLMTLECGIRFLTDYLQNDLYFKTRYPEHNLVRARTQFKLVADMENKWAAYQALVSRI